MQMHTINGRMITITENTMKHMEAHPDVDLAHLAEAISKISYNGGFLKTCVDMGRVVGKSSCVETDENDDIVYRYRKHRRGETRFVKNKPEQDTTKMVVIITDHQLNGPVKRMFEEPILITSWYGDIAPMEPWDARRKHMSEDYIKECDDFWSTHALVYKEDTIDFDKKD